MLSLLVRSGVVRTLSSDAVTTPLIESLTTGGQVAKLEASDVAIVKDTGYRHLTLTVSPDEENEEKTVTLDGMMPKEAEATVTDVTADYTDHEYPAE